jgi:DDE superfamily endonuclease
VDLGRAAGREHDTTCLRAHAELLPAVAGWTDDGHAVLGDLGYEGEQAALTTPVKRVAGWPLTDDERTINALHAGTRALAERGNALLKTTFKALRRVSLCPWRIGAITAAALALLHYEHGRTT